MVAGLLLVACTTTTAGRLVWEGRDEFVRVVPQDRMRDGAPASPNDHPARLTPQQVARALAEIKFEGSDDFTNVFDVGALDRLSPPLAEALAEAGPSEDAVFAVGTRSAHWLLGGELSSVAGRVFVVDGRMHVIFGDLFRPVISEALRDSAGTRTSVDRRLKPHRPGSRARIREPSRELVATGTTAFFGTDGRTRPDWLVIDLR